MNAMRYLISVPLIAVGMLLALYGVFLLVYKSDASGGRTYIKIAGSRIDAHLAGGISLGIAAALLASGIATVRRGRIGG